MLENVLLVGLAFALGGILKGATGAGAPLLAIPILALLYDVPTAITLFAIPNLVPNVWQAWRYRANRMPTPFLARFTLAGALGTGLGTYALANVNSTYLLLIVALAVVAYILFRLMRPDWTLPYATALPLAIPVGLVGGALQASGGISAPVSLTFLNAMQPERGTFISTISSFFIAIALVQIPLLTIYGFLTLQLFALSIASLVVIVAFMPVGNYLVRFVPKQVFDRIILGLLALLSLKMLSQVVMSHL
jgi:uncharacterized membrane protein YfcA